MTLREPLTDLALPPPTEEASGTWSARGTTLGQSPEIVARSQRSALEAMTGFTDAPASGALSDRGSEGDLADPEWLIEVVNALGRHRWPVWELAGRAPGAGGSATAHLGPMLEARIRPALVVRRHVEVRIEVREQGADVEIRVQSSGPPRRGAGGEVRLVVTDLLVFDRARGRLRLAVEHPARRALYQSAVGEVLFADPGWFSAPTVTLAPFLASPEGALRPTRTVGHAQVVGVELGGDAPEDAFTLVGARVLERLRALDLGDQLDQLQALTLDLQLDTREARIEIRPPHLIVYDRPREEPAVRAFLVERGLRGGSRGT